MNSKTQSIKLLLTGLFLCTLILSCGDDDESIEARAPLLPYNATEHIYGTAAISVPVNSIPTLKEWELVIDPNTGFFDTIPGTGKIWGGYSPPAGTQQLSSFANNQRYFLEQNGDFIIQDLASFEYDTIRIANGGSSRHFRFGTDAGVIYFLKSNNTIWKINLNDQTLEEVSSNLPIEEQEYISNLFYIRENGTFLITTNTESFNSGTVTKLILMNEDLSTVLMTREIDKAFGFVKHPERAALYFMEIFTTDQGFRLMELDLMNNELTVEEKSNTDLDITQLSFYLQTIHTATNTYICRGGSNDIESPTNTLYSIDLDSGELLMESELETTDIVLVKINGE